MKQIWPNYSYSPTTNVLTLTGLNIDRDQLLLVSAPERGRIMYNFADSTVTASAFTAGANTGLTLVASTAGLTTTAALVIYYDDQLASTTVTVSSLPAISGTVTVGNSVIISSLPAIRINPNYDGQGGNNGPVVEADSDIGSDPRYMVFAGGADNTSGEFRALTFDTSNALKVAGTVTVGNTVTIAGTVTANPTGTQTIAGTVTANTFALQGTAVTTSNFTSTTASTVLANFNATREVLTIFNEGAGNLHICAGATCTTIAYQVRLSAGDYFEVPNHQTTITHSAVFATAGTARVTEVS